MKTTVSKTQAFALIRDALLTTGLVKKIQHTEDYGTDKPTEKVLSDTVPELHRELNCLGPKNAYCRCYVPLVFMISEKTVTKEHWSMGHNHGECTFTEREFFEGHVGIDIHQDKGNESDPKFEVSYSVDTDLKGWKTIKDMVEYPKHLKRLVPIFQQVEVLLSGLNVIETPEDFAWVKAVGKAKSKPRKVTDLEEFGELCTDVINEMCDEEISVTKGLIKFLKKRGANSDQLKEFGYLLRALGDDKSELSGSPDSGVVERFQGHSDELDVILKDVLGSDYEELDLAF